MEEARLLREIIDGKSVPQERRRRQDKRRNRRATRRVSTRLEVRTHGVPEREDVGEDVSEAALEPFGLQFSCSWRRHRGTVVVDFAGCFPCRDQITFGYSRSLADILSARVSTPSTHASSSYSTFKALATATRSPCVAYSTACQLYNSTKSTRLRL